MERLQRASVILELFDMMKTYGSWCGETQIQRAMYFLQELAEVPTGFTFILYKHGPFSFDFRDELTALRADGLLELTLQPYPYSPSLRVTANGNNLKAHFPKTLGQYKAKIDFVAKQLGDKGVVDLERLATALYVIQKYETDDVDTLADKMVTLKPHVSVEQARNAIVSTRKMLKAA